MKYATKNNLEFMWEKIDNMLSEWYIMNEMFSEMKFMNEDEDWKLRMKIMRVDPSVLTSIKTELEQMIEEKGDSKQ